ncbi:hypothetical protein GCM10011395_08300 [Sphingomonas psychrolutea]|uniref:Uncharacterized protein n=1 Tax=Sphingomonas psychrolutea TaxID=1259676 RepID=A0ABQ1GB87_9SPHN|nr:hypothetical protein GCM10011395_08300 [Sphingomonas psychrolutea]
MLLIERELVVAGKGFAKRVDRAGADIAEHDANRSEREFGEAILARPMPIAASGCDIAVGRGGPFADAWLNDAHAAAILAGFSWR